MTPRLLTTRAALAELDDLRARGPLTLVPTMGALHEGHLSLVRRAAAEGGPVAVSIFVNPTQFGPHEDFDRYPRTLEADLELLAREGVDAVFAPSVEEMYAAPDGVRVEPGPRAAPLCGARRAGHFRGVLTVVLKLFHLVRPDAAVFGRKDAQQCLVIGEMVRDLDVPVRLIDAPTLREPDGLAMSSRNRYLSPPERTRALGISRALAAARRSLEAGERDRAAVEETLALHLADLDVVDYAEARRVPDLDAPDTLDGRVLLAVAAYVGATRLIDNLTLDLDGGVVRDAPLLEG
ncbi:MAG TPA: pantoate--beta-alanine ligase [Candidatus Krumholzibacteria bacterium]|nr:pantoate--beta-alanine ligase [Candidatus Krumholzibacteria bacterium]HRX51669.1 pantoate--beta-alanine ligase [Candidatus Krumholzibacteria bacterium]